MPNAIFYSPFSKTLESLILETFNLEKASVNMVTKGVPGERAVAMVDRLKTCLKGTKFDLVLICAGTNDS